MKEQQKHIIEHYVNSYNNFDVDGMTAHLTEDVVFENIANGEVDLRTEGLAAFKEQAAVAKQYFQQRNQTIKSWAYNESKVTIEISYTATLAIDLPNGLEKGDILELNGRSSFEFEHGKIKHITDES